MEGSRKRGHGRYKGRSPHVPKYGKEVYGLYRRVTPGISGLWQVSGRNNTTYEERVEMVAYYVSNWSVWLAPVILARTVRSVIFG